MFLRVVCEKMVRSGQWVDEIRGWVHLWFLRKLKKGLLGSNDRQKIEVQKIRRRKHCSLEGFDLTPDPALCSMQIRSLSPCHVREASGHANHRKSIRRLQPLRLQGILDDDS